MEGTFAERKLHYHRKLVTKEREKSKKKSLSYRRFKGKNFFPLVVALKNLSNKTQKSCVLQAIVSSTFIRVGSMFKEETHRPIEQRYTFPKQTNSYVTIFTLLLVWFTIS